MAANMWKNSLKNVESDNNKILYENLVDIFYSETVLTFWKSLVISLNMILKNMEMLDWQQTAVNSIVCPYVAGSVLLNVTKVG